MRRTCAFARVHCLGCRYARLWKCIILLWWVVGRACCCLAQHLRLVIVVVKVAGPRNECTSAKLDALSLMLLFSNSSCRDCKAVHCAPFGEDYFAALRCVLLADCLRTELLHMHCAMEGGSWRLAPIACAAAIRLNISACFEAFCFASFLEHR